MEGLWSTIFICHLIFGGHLLNIHNWLIYNVYWVNLLMISIRNLQS